MSKKKRTNKEITEAIDVIDRNMKYLYDKVLQLDSMLGLYLEFRKDTDKYDKFVKAKMEEFEKQQRSENKEGA